MNKFKIINSSSSLLPLVWILENMLKTNVLTKNKRCLANNVLLTKVDMLKLTNYFNITSPESVQLTENRVALFA